MRILWYLWVMLRVIFIFYYDMIFDVLMWEKMMVWVGYGFF